METSDRVPHSASDPVTAGSRAASTGPVIRVSGGAGAGPTWLAAFDAAMYAAGVAQYNLVRLSSVIPPGAVVREVTAAEQVNQGALGDVAYCVYAVAYASMPGEHAWAGLAWATVLSAAAGLSLRLIYAWRLSSRLPAPVPVAPPLAPAPVPGSGLL